MRNALFVWLLATSSLLASPTWALEPEQARNQILQAAFDLGLSNRATVQVLGFANSQTILAPELAEGLSQKLMGLFPRTLALRDAKQLGRLAPMIGEQGAIFEDQWRSLRQSDVEALALFEITSASRDQASVTVRLSNRDADEVSIIDIELPIDRRQPVMDLPSLARNYAARLVQEAKGGGRFVVLPVTSTQGLAPSCTEAIRQTVLAAMSSVINQQINQDDLSLTRAGRADLLATDLDIELSVAVAERPSEALASMTLTLASDRLGYFSPPAQAVPPPVCLAAIEVLQAPSKEEVSVAMPNPPSGTCEVRIQSMKRVFKIGDELTFQIQPSCDCWPVLVDYTDLNGTEVIRPQDLVHRLAFEKPIIPAGTTVNIPYSNEPYDTQTNSVYDFRLTIEPPTRSNTLGVVCAASRADAEAFSPAGVTQAASSRGFGAAMKKLSQGGNQNRYFSVTRTYYVE